MLDYIIERTIMEAEYIVQNKATIRACAKELGTSKSTVHSDINTRLPSIDKELLNSVRIILDNNFLIRHIRGGESTKQKYENIKQ